MSTLCVTDVSKRYGAGHALHSTSLSVEKGRTAVLIGQSGCGKSTLLRIIMGLITPDTGSVTFDGERMQPENALRHRHRMGYVIQDGGLFPHLSARDNVLLLARHLNREKEASLYLEELVELTQIPKECLARYPSELSGGQRQRVSLIRALVLNPELLLLDEPMGALDPMIRSDLQNDLKRICRTLGKTVLLVTHDLAEAAFFGDEIFLMRQGRVVQHGTFDQLIHSPADEFVSRFIQAQRAFHIPGEVAL
jgi:osmoprotectant transport system ATP-binding protein